MRISPKSVALVTVQLACLAFLMLTGRLLTGLPWVWLEIVGLYLGAWAIWTVQLRNVRMLPDPARNARLVTNGPYRFIRHPMYAAVLLITLSWLLDRLTLARLLVWLILTADLIAKLHYEERLLARRFSEYAAYQRRTKRLIPFVY